MKCNRLNNNDLIGPIQSQCITELDGGWGFRDELPDSLKGYIKDQSDQLNVHPSMILAPALSALGVAIGDKRKLHVSESHDEYAGIWTMSVLPPGELKSPSLKSGTRVISEIQEKYSKDFCDGKSSTLKNIRVGNVTTPVLNEILSQNRSVLWCMDEFASMKDILKMGCGSIGDVISYWSSEQVTVQRKTEKPIIIPSGYVFGVTTTTQTKSLKRLMNQLNGFENGFADRFLYCSPEPMEIKPIINSTQDSYKYLESYRELHYNFLDLNDEETLELDKPAFNLYRLYQYSSRMRVRKYEDRYYGKLDIHALRIALILKLVQNINAKVVTFDTLELSIKIVEYFNSLRLKLFDKIEPNKSTALENRIIEILRANPGLTVSELRKMFNSRNRPDRTDILNCLQTLIKTKDIIMIPKGRRDEYHVNELKVEEDVDR